MYQLYEVLEILIFIQGFNDKQEAIDYAVKLQNAWAWQGQDKHYRVDYWGAKVYEN
jgi:hypothetical protein